MSVFDPASMSVANLLTQYYPGSIDPLLDLLDRVQDEYEKELHKCMPRAPALRILCGFSSQVKGLVCGVDQLRGALGDCRRVTIRNLQILQLYIRRCRLKSIKDVASRLHLTYHSLKDLESAVKSRDMKLVSQTYTDLKGICASIYSEGAASNDCRITAQIRQAARRHLHHVNDDLGDYVAACFSNAVSQNDVAHEGLQSASSESLDELPILLACALQAQVYVKGLARDIINRLTQADGLPFVESSLSLLDLFKQCLAVRSNVFKTLKHIEHVFQVLGSARGVELVQRPEAAAYHKFAVDLLSCVDSILVRKVESFNHVESSHSNSKGGSIRDAINAMQRDATTYGSYKSLRIDFSPVILRAFVDAVRRINIGIDWSQPQSSASECSKDVDDGSTRELNRDDFLEGVFDDYNAILSVESNADSTDFSLDFLTDSLRPLMSVLDAKTLANASDSSLSTRLKLRTLLLSNFTDLSCDNSCSSQNSHELQRGSILDAFESSAVSQFGTIPTTNVPFQVQELWNTVKDTGND